MGRLTVAVDGRPLQAAVLGGAGRHLARLLPGVAAVHDVVVLHDPRSPTPVVDGPVALEPIAGPPRLPALAWLEAGVGGWLASRRDVLFHGAYYHIPFRTPGPSIATIHDISWETHPEDFPRAKRVLWARYGRHTARRADRVLTVSAFSRDELVSVYGIDPGRVAVTPDVVDDHFRPDRASAIAEVAARHGFGPRFVATLGGARRRGLAEAVSAWRRARASGHHDVDLVVVGSEAPPEDDGIVWLGRVDDDTWATVLAGAEALVYATRFEGYGLPAAEAAASGTPVVCAPVGSLPEVLGDAAAWASAPTGGALGRRLAALLDDPSAQAALRTAGLARMASAYTTEQLVADTAEAYDAAWAAARP